MAEMINLRTARKNQKRIEAEKLGEENRIKFGRTKIEKKITAAENVRAERLLEGHKRDS
jgi:hypothetical protein